MQKALVISYFFPPCNLTASQRAQSWATYFSNFGYKPVIVTRRWDHKISDLSDVSKPTPPEVKHEVFENYEVYYLPYHSNLRDKIYLKYCNARFVCLRKTLTLLELFLQPFFDAAIPYSNIYTFCKRYRA